MPAPEALTRKGWEAIWAEGMETCLQALVAFAKVCVHGGGGENADGHRTPHPPAPANQPTLLAGKVSPAQTWMTLATAGLPLHRCPWAAVC